MKKNNTKRRRKLSILNRKARAEGEQRIVLGRYLTISDVLKIATVLEYRIKLVVGSDE